MCGIGSCARSGGYNLIIFFATVLEAVERINREVGTLTVIITHNAAMAEMADRVLELSFRDSTGADADFDEDVLAIGRRALNAFGRDLSGDLSRHAPS